MKKKIFLPVGIAACLAVGIFSTVSADTNSETAAYVKDVVDSENVVFDSFVGNFASASEAVVDETVGDVASSDGAAYLPAVAAVSFDGESAVVSDTPADAVEPVEANVSEAPGAAVETAVVSDNGVGEIITEENNTEESFIEQINDNIITPVDTADHADDSKELTELENEIKPVTGQSPDNEDEASDEDVSPVLPEVEEEEAHEHEHTWKPVTEIVHHDAETHTEEVWVSVYDNNKSFSYADEDYNDICSVHVHGTIVEYRDDEILSVEGEEEAGTVDIYNHVTGESFTFAPGELENIDSFVKSMFDFEINHSSALIGPAWGYVEEVEVTDKESYDEEVITGYVCDCGEDKSL